MLFKTLALGLLGAASVAHAAQIPFTKNSRLECVLKVRRVFLYQYTCINSEYVLSKNLQSIPAYTR